MVSNIPLLLQPLLEDFTRLTEQEMQGRVEALYLEGSVALGAFNPRLSDIDFIAFFKDQAGRDDFERLSRIHSSIRRKYRSWKLQGIYLPWRAVGGSPSDIQPFPGYQDGKLSWHSTFELAPVTWWILKNCGITLFGPPAASLDLTVDMDQLRRIQQENLNTYWASWTKRPGRVMMLLSDWGIEWTVLGVLRQFYTLHEHRITSKIGAGEYALLHLPARWHAIIREAIALRQDARQYFYRSRLKRAMDAFRLLEYVIIACNNDIGRQNT